jgi:hypothetical protein
MNQKRKGGDVKYLITLTKYTFEGEYTSKQLTITL